VSVLNLKEQCLEATPFLLKEEQCLLVMQLSDQKLMPFLFSINEINQLSPLFSSYKNHRCKIIASLANLAKIKNAKLNLGVIEKEVIFAGQIQIVFDPLAQKVRVEKLNKKLNEEPFEKNTKTITAKKKVLIIDDSKSIQKLLTKIFSESSQFEVCGVADRPSVAKEMLKNLRPDLLTLDIHMPEMNGVEFYKSYLKNLKIPTAMITSVSIHEGPLVLDALNAGVMTYIQKPSIDDLKAASIDIIEKLDAISAKKIDDKKLSAIKSSGGFNHFDGLIAIGSSTGGTQALQSILTALPAKIPPIVIVQHIPAVFSKAFADRLNQLCPFTIKEAEHDEILRPNNVYIAPGGKQFKLKKVGNDNQVFITDDAPVNRFKPSVDYLFNSIPGLNENKLLGIILTGMGKDGAQGLLTLKNVGAFTIAQDEASSVVFGMPKEAINIGAAMDIVSLELMAQKMVTHFNNLKNKKAA
jgi:two-component system chemotaxis response regulator CheB